ncbi:MAG: hypothetical protein LBD59_03305 [Prevotellaceae bacterium]|jgi:hypothetical protein|nr:hypothetical protein [Prevotellaceae bacterium]
MRHVFVLKYLVITVFLLVATVGNGQTKVMFPEKISDKARQYIAEYKYILVIYQDGKECIACLHNQLKIWKKYRNHLKKYGVGVVLIFHGWREENIDRALSSHDLEFVHIVDKTGKFRTVNDKIFKLAIDSIFVVDTNKNLVFFDSPIKSEAIWNRFIKHIKNG